MARFRKNAASQQAGRSGPSRRERYFTDGRNLYRFLEWLTSSANVSFAAFEDCRTLGLLLVSGDQLAVSGDQLAKSGLRPVS